MAGAICGRADFIRSLMDLHLGPIMLLGPTIDPKIASELSLRIPHLGIRMVRSVIKLYSRFHQALLSNERSRLLSSLIYCRRNTLAGPWLMHSACSRFPLVPSPWESALNNCAAPPWMTVCLSTLTVKLLWFPGGSPGAVSWPAKPCAASSD